MGNHCGNHYENNYSAIDLGIVVLCLGVPGRGRAFSIESLWLWISKTISHYIIGVTIVVASG